MTFSVAARCAETGMFGVGVTSSSPAVAARCAFARAGVGAAASQNVTDPTLGVRALDLMAEGKTAKEALEEIARTSDHADYRQLTAVDPAGRAFVVSGSRTLGVWGEGCAQDVACAGNLLASEEIPARMAEAFAGSSGHLGDRIVAALRAGLDAGGEEGPLRSAGMRLVRDDVGWPVADLRVDWTDGDPIAELARLWEIYAPQLEDYVLRALDPGASPSYGVPGDE